MISYLGGRSWAEWSREERLFCSVLYEHARHDAAGFANWLVEKTGLEVALSSQWDLGFEVCFYRDLLHAKGLKATEEGYSPKRTFDFCLFSEEAIIVIEAKVCEPFVLGQILGLRQEAEKIQRMLDKPDLVVRTVGLATSEHINNALASGQQALKQFDSTLRWAQVAERYPDPILKRADTMFRLPGGAMAAAKVPDTATAV